MSLFTPENLTISTAEADGLEWFLRYGEGETLEVAAFLGYPPPRPYVGKRRVSARVQRVLEQLARGHQV